MSEKTCPCHQKHVPREEEEIRQLQNRLNRMTGQLSGVKRMLDENRYCGDILIQVSAVQSALRAFGDEILKSHMKTCVAEELRQGNEEIVDEAVELIRRLR